MRPRSSCGAGRTALRLATAAIGFWGSFASAAARADCVGMLNQTEQGYKIEGDRLEPSGPKVAAGTELEFTGIGRFKDRMFLTRARSDVIFDGANVELDSRCDLKSRDLPRAR